MGTWLIGRGQAIHLGASSIVFGLAAFLIGSWEGNSRIRLQDIAGRFARLPAGEHLERACQPDARSQPEERHREGCCGHSRITGPVRILPRLRLKWLGWPAAGATAHKPLPGQ